MMYRKCTGGNGFYDFQITPMDRGGGPASLLESKNHSRRNSGSGSE